MPVTALELRDGRLRCRLTGLNNTGNGAMGAIPNPENRRLLVTSLVIEKVTPSTGAANVDAGTAANGTTASDNLIDGGALNGAGTLTNLTNAGTNGRGGAIWEPTGHITFTGSADSSGLDAEVTLAFTPIGNLPA